MLSADLLWASLGTGKESSTFIPSKIFEYLAARRPIIGFFPEGEAADLIRKTGAGVVFTSDDIKSVILFLAEAVSAREARGFIGYKADEKLVSAFNVTKIVSILSTVLDTLRDNRASLSATGRI